LHRASIFYNYIQLYNYIYLFIYLFNYLFYLEFSKSKAIEAFYKCYYKSGQRMVELIISNYK